MIKIYDTNNLAQGSQFSPIDLNLINFSTMNFPGGESHVKIPRWEIDTDNVLVVAHIASSNDFIELMMVQDALNIANVRNQHLFIPYFPGARQDRPTYDPDFTPCGLEVYVDMLASNPSSWDEVTVLDMHSDVTFALLSMKFRTNNLSSVDAILNIDDVVTGRYNGVICPDAGAEKRTFAAAQRLGLPIFYARKHRDTATGKISGFEAPRLEEGNYLVIDDICDGGGTFKGLADAIRANHPSKTSANISLDLFVTHGIFSGQAEELLNYYTNIYSTDSWCGTNMDLHQEWVRYISVEGVYKNHLLGV